LIKSLSILLTDKCNLHCGHCIVNAHPRGTQVFDEQYLDNIISGMNFFGLYEVGISGGEPLLKLNLLQRVCSKLQTSKIKSIIATNAFWAKSPAAAYKVLFHLFKYDVTKIILSVDSYHQKQVPLDNIIYAVNAIIEHGRDYEVHISVLDYHSEYYYINELRKNSIQNVFLNPIEEAGRANLLDFQQYEKNLDFKLFECLKVENPAILLNGKIVACCDLLVAPEYEPVAESPLCLGDLRLDSVTNIIFKASNNKCLRSLRLFGPDGIWNKLQLSSSYFKSLVKPFEGCKLCYWLFGEPERASKVLKYLPPNPGINSE